ncbi:hypothetical protein RSOLAG1IB_09996 [Rhizoctonia solani AG-1 IB]|uniref:Uncharacterized protein n=2 Tax=Thanatephorus cucumeris (strain AG1-IB / isolate 7/3/14) TaxID=1108050 RepID=A0A0B7FWZ7_THACB|nr:hypothetical protein RSOLAG1IB_09996 [Rhizoctonia solani AG-1 IB]
MPGLKPEFNNKPFSGRYRIRALCRDRLYVQLDDNDTRIRLAADTTGSGQQWSVTPVEGERNTYIIKSGDGKYTLAWDTENPNEGSIGKFLVPKEGIEIKWLIQRRGSGGFGIAIPQEENLAVDFQNKEKVSFIQKDPNDANQLWIFENEETPAPQRQSFQTEFFPLSVKEAAQEQYDIIVVGSGIGGGVLVHDIDDTNFRIGPKNAKKVLLLERGSFTFHSHCLNTARPVDLVKDRGQHNDFYFRRFWQQYDLENTDEASWDGGPMYNLGGRSAAWGLFVPRIHDRPLRNHFSDEVSGELLNKYYSKAERLMNLSFPQTSKIHRHVIDRLNADGPAAGPDSQVQWNWARIASEFHSEANFNFAQGAYSTIDKIFEIAQGKENPDRGKSPGQGKNLQVALDAEVYSLVMDWTQNPPVATGVNIRTLEGDCVQIYLKQEGKVVLSAGSVNSPTILLRSGGDAWRQNIKDKHRGLQLTDHDIYIYGSRFRYQNPADRDRYGAMKLQTYFNVKDQPERAIGLANMSIDSSSFLPRGPGVDSQLPNFIMAFILECPLNDKNNIRIDDNGEPKVTINRGLQATAEQKDVMHRLTVSAMTAIETSLNVNFNSKPANPSELFQARLGIVAHELGTLPMQGKDKNQGACLDENLKVLGGICDGVYVCDLSIFPYSPEVNPSLTLAAFAIRLSRHLVDRQRFQPTSPDHVCVVNHSGSTVRARLSNLAGISDPPQPHPQSVPPGEAAATLEEDVVFNPGDAVEWKKRADLTEALFVRKQDQSNPGQFVAQPVVLSAAPGGVTVIAVEED